MWTFIYQDKTPCCPAYRKHQNQEGGFPKKPLKELWRYGNFRLA